MAEFLLSESLDRYLEDLVPARGEELAKMEGEARRSGFPIMGPTCGHFCYLVTRLIGARQVFGMGSGYGSSTAWFARAVRENGGGRVVHTVWEAALSQQARAHLTTLGYADIVEYRVAEAAAELRGTDGPFDLIFLDVDKEGYPAALDVIEDKLRPGGVLLADNMLLSGSILQHGDRSPRTQAVREFTRRIMEGDRWIGSIVPQRDGQIGRAHV